MAVYERLYLSCIDEQAPRLAKEYDLGLEITRYTWSPMMVDKSSKAFVKAQMAASNRFWFHAPFAELTPCAIDPLVRELSMKRYLQAAAIAKKFGINRMVLHGGFIPQVYYPEWFVEKSVEFWRKFLKAAPSGMEFVLENVFEPSPDLLVRVVAQLEAPNVGLCLDLGHALLTDVPLEKWLDDTMPFLHHVHIHNNDGKTDLHLPPDDGIGDMTECLHRICDESSATITLESQDSLKSLIWFLHNSHTGGNL